MGSFEPRFTHTTRFSSPSIAVKFLECGRPADPVGFDHEYEASRISLVRSGVFGRVVRGAPLLADSTQVLFVIDATCIGFCTRSPAETPAPSSSRRGPSSLSFIDNSPHPPRVFLSIRRARLGA